jgi:hypothetical protein
VGSDKTGVEASLVVCKGDSIGVVFWRLFDDELDTKRQTAALGTQRTCRYGVERCQESDRQRLRLNPYPDSTLGRTLVDKTVVAYGIAIYRQRRVSEA